MVWKEAGEDHLRKMKRTKDSHTFQKTQKPSLFNLKRRTQMPDFSKAKVGDIAFHYLYGEGKIIERGSVDILFRNDIECAWYLFSGKIGANDLNPSLFHGPIEIKEPPTPKRMKEVAVEVRPWKDCHGIVRLASNSLLTEHEGSPLNCGPIQRVKIMIEEDEE